MGADIDDSHWLCHATQCSVCSRRSTHTLEPLSASHIPCAAQITGGNPNFQDIPASLQTMALITFGFLGYDDFAGAKTSACLHSLHHSRLHVTPAVLVATMCCHYLQGAKGFCFCNCGLLGCCNTVSSPCLWRVQAMAMSCRMACHSAGQCPTSSGLQWSCSLWCAPAYKSRPAEQFPSATFRTTGYPYSAFHAHTASIDACLPYPVCNVACA